MEIWRDPVRAAELGARGIEGVRRHYTIAQMADAMEQVYGELCH
jgi:hypothetical protein